MIVSQLNIGISIVELNKIKVKHIFEYHSSHFRRPYHQGWTGSEIFTRKIKKMTHLDIL
jgi:hypothetical protein